MVIEVGACATLPEGVYAKRDDGSAKNAADPSVGVRCAVVDRDDGRVALAGRNEPIEGLLGIRK